MVIDDTVGLRPVGGEAVMTPGDDASVRRRKRNAEAPEAPTQPAMEIDEAEMETRRRDHRHATRRGGGRPFGQRGAGVDAPVQRSHMHTVGAP